MRRKHVRLIALLLVVGVVRPSSEVFAASSDGSLLAPSEVVLYVHTELPNTAFLDPLICALQRVLLAPVSTKKIDLKLGPELLASPTQFDVGKVANRFIQATAGDGESHTFKYLLMPSDLKATPYRYVFATSFGDASTAYHVGIVSTARLRGDPKIVGKASAEITALRLYKLILKSVARVCGYGGPDRCVLAFPKNLPELDEKSAEFCPEDRMQLVAAGILKPKENGGCGLIVDASSSNSASASDPPRGAQVELRQ